MLSLRRNIDRIDREDRKLKAVLNAFLKTVSVMKDLPVGVDPETSGRYKEAVRQIEGQLAASCEPDVLGRSCEELRSLMKGLEAEANEAAQRREDDVRALFQAFGEAIQIVAQHNTVQTDRLEGFTSRLQGTEKINDLSLIRRQITSHLRDLKAIAEKAQGENNSGVAVLEKELAEFRYRLDNAERRASHDALTGLLNRGEGEERLASMLEKGGMLTAILLDLNDFKQINDTLGHAAGDQVLKLCARVLNANTGFSDLVCRWGGDEFLVVLRCDMAVAAEWAAKIDADLRVARTITVSGRKHAVSANAALGVVGHATGEDAHEFVARADAQMYRKKDALRKKTH